MERLRSVVEAAGLLGVSIWSVRAWEREGKIQAVRLGRRVMFEDEELERFVAQNRAKPHGGHRIDADSETQNDHASPA